MASTQTKPKTAPELETEVLPEDKPKKTEADVAAAAATFEEMASKKPVIVKLARIMEALPELKPEGHNQHFGYSYIKDTQISGALRKALARERVMIVPDVVEEEWVETRTARGGVSYVTKMKINFTAIDGDSGDSISGHGFGYGDDSGDKGANKAFTAALKYWLLKLFQIGGEDLESDQRADQRAMDRDQGMQEVQIESAQVDGVQRGGRQDKISKAQAQTLLQLYKDLELTPEGFALRFDRYLGIPLRLEEDADASAQLNQAVKGLSGDDAGTMITKMVEEKDARDVAADQQAKDEADD